MIFIDFSKPSKVFKNNFKTFEDFKPDLWNEGFSKVLKNPNLRFEGFWRIFKVLTFGTMFFKDFRR